MKKQKPLFDFYKKEEIVEVPKKRGRPKKEQLSTVVDKNVETKKRGRPKKEKVEEPKSTTVENRKRGRPRKEKVSDIQVKTSTQKKEFTCKPERGWKDFNTSKPKLLVPCEFYVDTGKDKITFRGYVAEKGVTCTDEPYKLVVLRKKYSNIFYKEIVGCASVNSCPDKFPNCEYCKIFKERSKGNKK